MATDNFFRNRRTSAFVCQASPVRRSLLLESRLSVDDFECRLRELPFSTLGRYQGHLTEYSFCDEAGRLVISAGALGNGLTGIAVEYWGACERAFRVLERAIREIAGGRSDG